MKIYRLEHRSSGLGPFMHKSSRRKHPDQAVLLYLYTCARAFMPDVAELPEVKELLRRYPKAVFGWDSLEKFYAMIKDPVETQNLGFILRVYEGPPLYNGACGQVLFQRRYIQQQMTGDNTSALLGSVLVSPREES